MAGCRLGICRIGNDRSISAHPPGGSVYCYRLDVFSQRLSIGSLEENDLKKAVPQIWIKADIARAKSARLENALAQT